jgi:hypothetical protein
VSESRTHSLAGAPAPRFARSFVALFLAALLVCAIAPFNLWPFSNWELFSRLRSDQETGWEMVAIDRTDRGRVDPLPHGYRSFSSVIAQFPRRSSAQRDAICAVWVRDATQHFGPSTRLLRIYQLEWLLTDRHGHRRAPRHRTLVWICTAKGARHEA